MVNNIQHWAEFLLNPSKSPYSVLFLAAFCGGALGTERQKTGHTQAGRRTLAMVSLGSCLFTILPMIHGAVADPWRMGAQVITGIGFLGAGVLIKENLSIKGLTTASTIWVTAAIGVCFGAGEYAIAFFTTIFALGILLTNKITKSTNDKKD